MPLFKFTGDTDEVFPTIVTADGALVASPGLVVTLATDPQHPRLVPVDADHAVADAIAGTVLVDADRAPWPGLGRTPADDDVPADDPSPRRRRSSSSEG